MNQPHIVQVLFECLKMRVSVSKFFLLSLNLLLCNLINFKIENDEDNKLDNHNGTITYPN